ncbi:MAG: hypothetical protein ACLP9K_04970 [Nitrososphaerales archaeon]
MTFEDISLADLDSLIDDTTSASHKVKEKSVKEQLTEMRRLLEEMRVAIVEIRHLDQEFKRGNMMTEPYNDRHTRLVRSYFGARDEIADVLVSKIAESANNAEDKGRIVRFGQFLKDKKDFLLNASQLILTIVQIFAR